MELNPQKLQELDSSLSQGMALASTEDQLELFRREWLSKEGTIRSLFKLLKDVPVESKPTIAAHLNQLKERAETFVANKESELKKAAQNSAIRDEFFDVSLPSSSLGVGAIHGVRLIERRIAEILRPFGFNVVHGPEIETDYYCFDALNIPPHHPARDMQDTFYTANGLLLRTHTTSVQSRVLQQGVLPVKVAAFGRVYRNETEDPSHQAMFHQFELVWLEKGLTVSHLMGLITHILKQIYGKRRKVRFVPKFYPYTEPSLGPQIDCSVCGAKGCSSCGGSGWVTIAGSGMIHRQVLKEFKYDPDAVTGFAFGLGTSRLAAQFLGFPTLKAVYDNDLRVVGGSYEA